MKFQQFLERDDLPKIKQFEQDSERLYQELVQYYAKFWETNFPKRKRGEDEHDYIMSIRRGSETWKYSQPKLYGYNFYFARPPQGHWTSVVGELGAEVLGKSVAVYVPFYDSFWDAYEWSNAYLSAWIDRKPSRATNAKKEAKKAFDQFMKGLQDNQARITKSLYHEIIHAARHAHIKDPQIPLAKVTRQLVRTTYANNPPELDAHFLEKAHRVLSMGKYTSFQDFLQKFREILGEPHWELLVQKNQRKMIGRLYQLYSQTTESFRSWLENRDDYIKYHNTGYIASHAYEDYEKDGGLSWLGEKNKYPVLVRKATYGPYEVEFRMSGEKVQYTKLNDEGWPVYGPDGLALMLSPEEMKAKELRDTDSTIVAFIDDKPIGFASNEFGAIGVWVERKYQKLGIGSDLLVMFMEDNPRFLKGQSKIGQMTNAGWNMTGKAYDKLEKKYGKDWFKPPK